VQHLAATTVQDACGVVGAAFKGKGLGVQCRMRWWVLQPCKGTGGVWWSLLDMEICSTKHAPKHPVC